MEAETIDLTDPLEDLLRQTGWTPEYLQERLQRLSVGNASKPNVNTKDLRDMTLSDLLGDYKCSNRKDVEVTETIELSDDDVSEVIDHDSKGEDHGIQPGGDATQQDDATKQEEIQEVNEVRVVEIDEYDSECNDDDDDEFLEESRTETFHTGCYSVIGEDYFKNDLILNKNRSSSLHCVDAASVSDVPCSSQREELLGKVTTVLIGNYVEEAPTSIVKRLETTPLASNSDKYETTMEATQDNTEKVCANEDTKQNQDISTNHIKDLENKILNSSDNTHKMSENSMNLENTIKMNGLLSCKSLSSDSYKGAVSERDELIHHKISENNEGISDDLGFIVSEVQGGVDLIESSAKNVADEAKMEKIIITGLDNLPIAKKDIVLDETSVFSTENKKSEDSSATKLDRDSSTASYDSSEKSVDQTELDASVVTKFSDNSHLGFIVSNVQGGIDLMDLPTNITNAGMEDPITAKEKSTSNGVVVSNNKNETVSCSLGCSDLDKLVYQIESDATVVKESTDNTHLGFVAPEVKSGVNLIESPKQMTYIDMEKTGSKRIEGTKSIQKSIDNLINQLDEACEKQDITDTLETHIPSSEGSEMKHFVSQTVTIDSPMSLLLKSLDKAIETCEKDSELLREDLVQRNPESIRKVIDGSSISSPNNSSAKDIEFNCSSIEKPDKIIDKSKKPTELCSTIVTAPDADPTSSNIVGINMKNENVNLDDSNKYASNENPDKTGDSKIQNNTAANEVIQNDASKNILNENHSPLSEGSKIKRFVSQALAIDSSKDLLLESLEEAIDICKKDSELLREDLLQGNPESDKKVIVGSSSSPNNSTANNIAINCSSIEKPDNIVDKSKEPTNDLCSTILKAQDATISNNIVDINVTNQNIDLDDSNKYVSNENPEKTDDCKLQDNIGANEAIQNDTCKNNTNKNSLETDICSSDGIKVKHFSSQTIDNSRRLLLKSLDEAIDICKKDSELLRKDSFQGNPESDRKVIVGSSVSSPNNTTPNDIEINSFIQNPVEIVDKSKEPTDDSGFTIIRAQDADPTSNNIVDIDMKDKNVNLNDSNKYLSIREPDKTGDGDTQNNIAASEVIQNDTSENNTSDDTPVEETSHENFEEIRKNLKLQLTSLRNRKRMNILQDVKTKDINIEFSKNYVLFDSINKPIEKPNENLQLMKQDLLPRADPAQQTESDSTIEKQGHVDVPNVPITQELASSIDSDEAAPQPESPKEKQEDEEIPNFLNEIRRIIRKQKTGAKLSMIKYIHDSEDIGNGSQQNDTMKEQEKEEVDPGASNSTIENKQDRQTPTSSILSEENTSTNNVVNSPFVSNSLDEFLTDAKLNVSYAIPKSGAEEGLRQTYSDEPIMPPVISEIKEDVDKPAQETKYKPKTLAEKRRLLEKNKLKEKKRLEKLKNMEKAQKRSYVLFKDKKIFLRATSMGQCIASIEPITRVIPKNESSQQITPRKPSLLTELFKKVTTPVKYRPGPLCKKHLLQTDYSNWSSELQTLPKVFLKIMPQLGKPIHPNLLHVLPLWDGEVTDNQIDFALSALVTKEERKRNKIFKFNVPYENQKTQILTRKRILDIPTVQLEQLSTTKTYSSTAEEDVAEVIEKLLNYVEIKEIEPTLVKYDKDSATSDEDPLKVEILPLDNHILVKRKSRISRTDRELIRLNCKVVSVEVEENEPVTQCSKPYCRLGCICKSLQCERIIGLHCQKVKCIFGCTCPKEKDKIISITEPTIKLPAGTDLLSMDTVTRIEGEAKRHLARVEKEFTQTVILTNDKTIVVGFGNKPRRATKTPKKYTDFFDDEVLNQEGKEPKKENIIPVRPCYVVLEKWNFSDILPYCLVHHLYRCHCRGHSVFVPPFETFKTEPKELLNINKEENNLLISDENSAKISLNKIDLKKQIPKQTVEESFMAIVRKSAAFDKNVDTDNEDDTRYSVTGRPLRKRKKIYEADFVFDVDGRSSCKPLETERDEVNKTQMPLVFEPVACSRTRAICFKYYRKSKSYSNAALFYDFANNLTQSDLLKASQQENDNDISDSDWLKRTIIEDRKKLLEDTETEIHKKKRKQKIHVRKDEDITIKTSVPVPKKARKGRVKAVFKGEIIVNDAEWLKKLGQNAKQPLEGYARILPWTALLNGFLLKSINIYCISDMPLRLLLNVGQKLTGAKIMDVEKLGHQILDIPLTDKPSWLRSQSENVREIIKWLLSGTLPSKYKSNSLSFLLVETLPSQFEVRGLCTQGENNKEEVQEAADVVDEGEVSDQITEVKHKNMKNEVESLFITKCKFRLRELVEDGCDDDHTDNLYMWVGLPQVYKLAKWRVVFLNNDFSYLYFKNIQYSIKYMDLLKLTELAKKDMLTLVLKNVQIRRSYEHTSFGIYISHNYADRIFIGPYFLNYDEDEVETLKYINQQLVCAESFNKMTGHSNHRCGHWMYERTYSSTPTVYMKDTIDLTNEDSVKPGRSASKDDHTKLNTNSSLPVALKPTAFLSVPQPPANLSKDEHIIYHNGMSIVIKNCKPRAPSEFNRFIITNIPHFGYLGAYQPSNSSILEVSWPFEKKVLQFENADNARDFLQERFNQLLQPVPDTFKIQVIVLIQLDLMEHQPINSDFLSGHCICGYFGTYNFRELSDEFCKERLNVSKEEITRLFAKRAHAYIRNKIEEVAVLVGIDQSDPLNFNVPNILDKAREEIRLQENIRKSQISEIQAYELNVIAKMKKLYATVNTLPPKEQNIESKIINEILQIRPNRLGCNEVVEIKDDDDDPLPNAKSDLVVSKTTAESDTKVPKTAKKPLKRKQASDKKTVKPKMPKLVPLVPAAPVEESAFLSVLKPQPHKDYSVKNALTFKGKPKFIIVKNPSQLGIYQSPSEAENMEPITINEDTETIIIDQHMQAVEFNEDNIETVTLNEELDSFRGHKDIETVTINEDTDPIAMGSLAGHKEIETVVMNEDIRSLTDNKDVEVITINEDTETDPFNDISAFQFEDSENFVDGNVVDGNDDDASINHYIIEYDGCDPNFTELLVSHTGPAENVDLSKATIIASVPPTNDVSDRNLVTPETQCSLPKTYSKENALCTITSVHSIDDDDTTDDSSKEVKRTSCQELTGKIKVGLKRIMQRAEANLPLYKDEEDETD